MLHVFQLFRPDFTLAFLFPKYFLAYQRPWTEEEKLQAIIQTKKAVEVLLLFVLQQQQQLESHYTGHVAAASQRQALACSIRF